MGRVVAWTSDASARWASEWVAWQDFSRFWGQAVAWSINAGAQSNLETRISLEDKKARIVVDARDEAGQFLDGLTLSGAVLKPAGDSLRVALQQTAPGRYESTFSPQNEGAYFLTISGAESSSAEAAFSDLNGWVMSYSPEYIPRPQDASLLAEIAEITGGRNLEDTPAAVFTHDMGERQAATDIWQSLILLALLLLPFDIALRRLIITRGDMQRLRAYFARRGRQEARSGQMQALFTARGRSRQSTDYGARVTLRRTPDDSEPAAPSTPTPAPSRPAAPENLGARLLRGKRQRRGED